MPTVTHLTVLTRQQQVEQGSPFDLATTEYVDLSQVVLLEGATSNGATGAYLIFKTKDGKTLVALTTGATLDSIGGAARGTIERFGK